MKASNKIILLGLCLLIIAGIVVVRLTGFNVSLIYQKHESISLYIAKPIDLNEIKAICKEVFKDKDFVIREVEIFGDSVNINVKSITDEEKNNLINKINEKYQTEILSEDVAVNSNAKIRIRDIVRPYIKPVLISAVLIMAYIIIRFKKMKVLELLGKICVIISVTELALASIIAIIRVPVSPIIINLLTVVAVIELLIYINKLEKTY